MTSTGRRAQIPPPGDRPLSGIAPGPRARLAGVAGPRVQGATVREAIRSFLARHDPLGINPARTLRDCGLVLTASAALFWAIDSRAADIVLLQTEAIRQSVAWYPELPQESVAISLLDGTADVAGQLGAAEMAGKMMAPAGPGAPAVAPSEAIRKTADPSGNQVVARFRDAMTWVTEAFRRVAGPVAAGALAALTVIVSGARLFFEIKGIASTLAGFYRRRHGMAPEQRIARLEAELRAVKSERDALTRAAGNPGANPGLEARLARMERQMREDREKVEQLMEKGVSAWLGDLDRRKVSIRLGKEEIRRLAGVAALTGQSPATILENRLARDVGAQGDREGTHPAGRRRPILSEREDRAVRSAASRILRGEDTLALAGTPRGRGYETVLAHLRRKHADPDTPVPPAFHRLPADPNRDAARAVALPAGPDPSPDP